MNYQEELVTLADNVVPKMQTIENVVYNLFSSIDNANLHVEYYQMMSMFENLNDMTRVK